MSYKAIVVGGSGLIGRKLINVLSQWPEYDEIVSLGRKKIKLKNKKLSQLIVDFDKLEDYAAEINGHAVFCCLGSTKKKTPDLKEYRKIDHDYPVKLAEIAKKNGVEQFHLVSSLGANKNSSAYYTRMKGETEEDLKKVGTNSLFIYQPSILTGNRTERRPVEKIAGIIMKIIDPLLFGSLKKYKSISAYTVAFAMFKTSLKNKQGTFTYPSDKIKEIK